jgi:hypothetical protein
LDGIIGVIYPNLDEYEAKEESMILEINKSLMQVSITMSVRLTEYRAGFLLKVSKEER